MKSAFAGLAFKLQKHITQTSKLADLLTILKYLTTEQFEDLETTCSSIEQVFDKLHPFISFFDFEIIKLLTSNLGSGSNKQKLKKYKKMFNEFSKQRVCKCPSDAFGDVNQSERVLVIKADKIISTLTVESIMKLKYELCKVLGFKSRLLRVDDGCVKLTFRVPQYDEIAITEEQKQALRQLSVLRIQYGNEITDIPDAFIETVPGKACHT